MQQLRKPTIDVNTSRRRGRAKRSWWEQLEGPKTFKLIKKSSGSDRIKMYIHVADSN